MRQSDSISRKCNSRTGLRAVITVRPRTTARMGTQCTHMKLPASNLGPCLRLMPASLPPAFRRKNIHYGPLTATEKRRHVSDAALPPDNPHAYVKLLLMRLHRSPIGDAAFTASRTMSDTGTRGQVMGGASTCLAWPKRITADASI